MDDCDIRLPIVNAISNDINDLPQELRDAFPPSNLEDLTGLWIKLLQLSMEIGRRPASTLQTRPLLWLSQLESGNAKVSPLVDSLPQETDLWSPALTLHMRHLEVQRRHFCP